MNGDATSNELPELTDEDINILDSICKLAASSSDLPFKALFAAYDAVLEDQGIHQQHDDVIFRWVMRVGEAVGNASRAGADLDYIGQLRQILDAHGITVVDNEGEIVADETQPEASTPEKRRAPKRPVDRRRVSFDDARYEETWLNEHTQVSVSPGTGHELLSRPAIRGKVPDRTRRNRSASPERNMPQNLGPSSRFQHASSLSPRMSGPERHYDPTLLFQPSQTELEQNAEAFFETSALRYQRYCLDTWHNATLNHQQRNHEARQAAIVHDYRTLLRQALDQWRIHLGARRVGKEQALLRSESERHALQHHQTVLKNRSINQWTNHLRDVEEAVAPARRQILRLRYFKRWKTFSIENTTKTRLILTRKWFRHWQLHTERNLLLEDYAGAKAQENLVKNLWMKWYHSSRERRVESWSEQKRQGNMLSTWKDRLDHVGNLIRQADAFQRRKLLKLAWNAVTMKHDAWLRMSQTAADVHMRRLESCCMATLRRQKLLVPRERTFKLKLSLDLERSVFGVWHRQVDLNIKAAEANHERLKRSIWIAWNDALRIKTLSKRIDERLVLETLYKWVLDERLRLCCRARESRIQRQLLQRLQSRTVESRMVLNDQAVTFSQDESRRRLSSAFQRIHLAIRRREDAERAAVEFSNAKILPRIFGTLKEKTEHARSHAKWAKDAEFFVMTKKALGIWREKTTAALHERRKQAYVRIRARVKVRLVTTTLSIWREQTLHIRTMAAEAEERVNARHHTRLSQAFSSWSRHVGQRIEQANQAANLDASKLAYSALSALVARHETVTGMTRSAEAFAHDVDLAMLDPVLKRLRFATFAILQLEETSDALRDRIKKRHVVQMLRHWATSATTQRNRRVEPAESFLEPDSPSLRPASRAASRPESRPPATSPSSRPPREHSATPAYLRTPSRGRRQRFRPIPTPAPYTPLAFSTAYLTTTPAPFLSVVDTDNAGVESLTPQITPFARKLRAGGVAPDANAAGPASEIVGGIAGGATGSALRSSFFGRSIGPAATGTGKSVRFAGTGGRFSRSRVERFDNGAETLLRVN